MDGGGARLQRRVGGKQLYKLHRIVGRVLVEEPGRAVHAAHVAHIGVPIAEAKGQRSVSVGVRVRGDGLAVLPVDGVYDGVAVGVADDGIGLHGDPVHSGPGVQRAADPVDDFGLGGGGAEYCAKGLSGGLQHAAGRGTQTKGAGESCGRAQGTDSPQRNGAPSGRPDGLVHQLVDHFLFLLRGKPQLIHGFPIGLHASSSCSSRVRSRARPRFSRVEMVAGFSPSSRAISLAA